MTKKQIQHYLKGGKFIAIYNPKKLDISEKSQKKIGEEVTCYQNMVINPLNGGNFIGQHAFNSPSIYGWIPEEDLDNLTIIDEFIENPEKLPVYCYRLIYTTKEQMVGNFGESWGNVELPYIVGREYSFEADSYILGLSEFKPTRIEKALYTGKSEELEWKELEWMDFKAAKEQKEFLKEQERSYGKH